MSNVARIHQGLGFLFLTLGLVNFFLAGLLAFAGGDARDAHQGLGSLLGLLALVLLILAVVGRRAALPASAALFVLMILQTVLAVAGEDVGFLGGLHAVNGLLILFTAHQAARGLPLPFGDRSARGATPPSVV